MWFKNLVIYRFVEPFELSAESLDTALAKNAFTPCGPNDISRYGWVSPLHSAGEQLVHAGSGFIQICAKTEERILPGSVVSDYVQQRADDVEESTGSRPRGKRLKQIREEVIIELTPKAFTRNRRCYAWIAPKLGLLVVDASTAKRAEELTTFLRKTLGTLPLEIPKAKIPVSEKMSRWLSGAEPLPTDFEFSDECELREPVESGGIIRCRNYDLQSDEIQQHLEAGKEVVKLALNWSERISFLLDDDLGIKRLRFGDDILEESANTGEADEAAKFDADFTLMSLEFAAFLPRMLELLCK